MLKIKDYILNENDISYIVGNTDDRELKIQWKDNTSTYIKASFDDIEWNYGTPQETQRKMQKELCKSCYYRDTISNKLKELEEENERLKVEVDLLNDNRHFLNNKIDKAIKYLNLKVDLDKNHLLEAINDMQEDLLEILKKGE